MGYIVSLAKIKASSLKGMIGNIPFFKVINLQLQSILQKAWHQQNGLDRCSLSDL
jgi:hypothetical protein